MWTVVSGIWRAERGENFAFAILARTARRKILQRWTRSPVFSGIRRAQRGENFATLVQVTGQVRLGHPFSLVSGARSAEKILLLQPWRAQRGPVLPLGQR